MPSSHVLKADRLRGKVNFAIVTIREDEEAAIRERFPPMAVVDTVDASHVDWPYGISCLKVHGGYHLIATIRCLRQGNNEAQRVTSDLIRNLEPKVIFAVGIAGGVPDSEFTLGDVILSSQVYDLTLAAIGPDGVEKYSVGGGYMSKIAEQLLTSLPVWGQPFDDWNDFRSIGCARPKFDPTQAHCYGSPEYQERLKTVLAGHFTGPNQRSHPIFSVRPVLSSNRLIKNTEMIDLWQTFVRPVAAIEMEFAGVYSAARGRGPCGGDVPVITIRGLSDIVGLRRDSQWTGYACHSAAALTRALIEHCRILPPVKGKPPVSPAPPFGSSEPLRGKFGVYDWGSDDDDPNFETVGHEPEKDGFKLSVTGVEWNNYCFWFDAAVQTAKSASQWGPVRFALHPSYPRPLIAIRTKRQITRAGKVLNESRIEEVNGEEAFTIVAEILRKTGGPLKLGFDLHEIPGLPDKFKWRPKVAKEPPAKKPK